jgi:uncharacterized caspase-like protein
VTARRSALIVATSQYRDSRLAALEGPGEDAEALRTVLANKAIGGFDVRVALNSRVETLRRTLEGFFADRARDDLLLIHFSGHGLKDDDGQLYLAAADTQIDRLLSTGIDAAWVNRLMNRCRSERIALFLDCCFAGAFTTGMTRRVGMDTAGVKEQFTGSGLFVITASDAMQYSFEGGRQVGQPPEPSPFTKALVDGLRSGEADRDEDGHVSINELFDYLEDRIRETSPSQTPTKSAFNQVGDWVIAQSTRAPSVRLLPAAVQQQLKSENPLDRIGALFDLRDLIEGPDQRLADAAMQSLQRLAQDDSRTVAARAQHLLDEETARPRSAARSARRRTAPTATEAAPIGPESEPIAPDPARIEPATPRITPPVPADITRSEPAPTPSAAAASPSASGVVAGPVAGESGIQTVAAEPHAPPVPAPAAQARGESSGGVEWSPPRAGGRAAIGSFLGMLLQYAWFLAENPKDLEDPAVTEYLATLFSEMSVVVVIAVTITVAIAEKLWPAVRVPGGAAYRAVGGNRWVAAGILGAVAGLTVGLAAEYLYLTMKQETTSGLGWQAPICAAIGFVIAEAIVGRRFGGHREERSVGA